MKWQKILNEYQQGAAGLRKYRSDLSKRDDNTDENEAMIASDMYNEINQNIVYVRRHQQTELQKFLESDRSALLTDRQLQVMSMRARGMSMDEIAMRLGISKTAVFKSVRLSEKKIYGIVQ